MSYTTKLSSVLRCRPVFGRIITSRSIALTSSSRVFSVVSSRNLPVTQINNSQFKWQNGSYSTDSTRTNLGPQHIPQILDKLSSNTVTLKETAFKSLRPKIFTNYDIDIEKGFAILKSCSQLVDRSPDDRLKLVNEAWNELMSIIKSPTKNQLILLLQAYRRAGLKSLDNHREFFEKYNCPIDIDLYAELMYIMCANQDTMQNAEALLNEISAAKLKPNEQIYNALILGYSKQGVDAVEKVLQTMQTKKITPSLKTNTELIQAYLRNGNSDKAVDILQQSDDYNIDQLSEIIRCAAFLNNGEIIEKALTLLSEPVRNAKFISSKIQNICIEIVHMNRSAETKLDAYNLIIRQLPSLESNNSYGLFLIEQMIDVNTTVSEILGFCENLIESKRNLYAIHACCEYALRNKLQVARDFLEALAAKEPLLPHYFWPLFSQTSNQTEVIEVINFAAKFNIIMDIETLQNYVLPRMNTLIRSQEVVKALTDIGVRMIELKTAIIIFLLQHNRPKEALDIASKSKSAINPRIIAPELCNFIKSNNFLKNHHTVATLIQKLASRQTDKSFDLAGEVADTVCNKRDQIIGYPLTQQLLVDYKKLEMQISTRCANSILGKIRKHLKVSAFLNPIIQTLHSKEISTETGEEYTEAPNKNDLDIEALKQQLTELEANKFPTHGVLFRLFQKYVQLNQYDKAWEIKQKCDETGVIETPSILSSTLKLCMAKGDVDKAIKVLNTLESKHPRFKVDAYKRIDLLTLLITKDRLDEAKEMAAKYPQNRSNTVGFSQNVWNLLNMASQYGTKNGTQESISAEFLDVLIKKGYCEPSKTLYGTVVKEHLDKHDIMKAIETFEHCVTNYRKTPQLLTLLISLVDMVNSNKASDFGLSNEKAVESLQHVINLAKQVHGPENANVNVIMAFASLGRVQQLRKILINPDIKFNDQLLMKNIEHLKNQSKTDVVLTIARSARGLNYASLSEEKLYEMVLSHYVRKNDCESAVDLFENMQIDTETPISKKFCITLTELLTKNKKSLPTTLKIKAH